MRIAYFDCFAGLSGEMLLGALVGAGLSFERLQNVLAGLRLPDYTLDVQSVVRKEQSGTYLSITETVPAQSNYSLNSKHVEVSPIQIIGGSTLPDLVKQTSLAIFRRLAQAEAAVFPNRKQTCSPPDAAEAVVTVVGVIAGLALLGIDRVECSPIHVGCGVTYSEEGIKPALSPVTAEILRAASVPIYGSPMLGRMVTAVGAAIITTLASAFGAIPAMKIGSVGYGAGKHDIKEAPNLVRLFIGETTAQTNTVPILPKVSGTPPPAPSAPMDSDAQIQAEESTVKPFFANHDEWTALGVSGHQQSGRQRLAS